jgi:hypothetical protein
VIAASFGFSACEEDFSKREFYEYLVYLLSKETHNVYSVAHPFQQDGIETVGFFSIGCGGSLTNPDEFTVELELNNDLFHKFNRLTFDIDSSKFARLLPANRFRIEQWDHHKEPSMTVYFPKNNIDRYVKVRVHVSIEGLSPDSTYFIPLDIKNVTNGFQTNPEKYNMLYRVDVKNYYASAVSRTLYTDRGKKLEVFNPNVVDVNQVVIVHDSLGQVAETKAMKPLSLNSVRVMCGEEKEARLGNPTVNELIKGAMILTIDDDNNVKIAPYGTIQIDQMDGLQADGISKWNIFREESSGMEEWSWTIEYFYLRYRYRTQIVGDNYTPWSYVQTVLRRQ